MEKYYEVLELEPFCNEEQVKKSYRRLVKKYHPDMAKNKEQLKEYKTKMQEITEAYKMIKNIKVDNKVCNNKRTIADDYIDKIIYNKGTLLYNNDSRLLSILYIYTNMQKLKHDYTGSQNDLEFILNEFSTAIKLRTRTINKNKSLEVRVMNLMKLVYIDIDESNKNDLYMAKDIFDYYSKDFNAAYNYVNATNIKIKKLANN